MKFNPLHDRVVVKRVDADTQTSGGIIIPDSVAEKPDQGIVIAIGAGRRTEAGALVPMTVKVNDLVLFPRHAGTAVKVEGEEVLVLDEEEIFAIIEGN
jgi:chaperonin GroES